MNWDLWAGVLAGCDLILDGVKALRWFWATYEHDWGLALAHYNSGEKIYASSRAYARRIMRRAERIDEQVAVIQAQAAGGPDD